MDYNKIPSHHIHRRLDNTVSVTAFNTYRIRLNLLMFVYQWQSGVLRKLFNYSSAIRFLMRNNARCDTAPTLSH